MENNIIDMLSARHQYETELQIILDCSTATSEIDLQSNNQYVLLTQRLSLISHWLKYVSPEESLILRLHLVEKEKWDDIVESLMEKNEYDIGCDRRTLQRIQRRAVKKLSALMQRYGNSMDHLFPNHN